VHPVSESRTRFGKMIVEWMEDCYWDEYESVYKDMDRGGLRRGGVLAADAKVLCAPGCMDEYHKDIDDENDEVSMRMTSKFRSATDTATQHIYIKLNIITMIRNTIPLIGYTSSAKRFFASKNVIRIFRVPKIRKSFT
jgi:hypothetical protein